MNTTFLYLKREGGIEGEMSIRLMSNVTPTIDELIGNLIYCTTK